MKIKLVKIYENPKNHNICYHVESENGQVELYNENNVPSSIITLICTKKPLSFEEGKRTKYVNYYIYTFD